MPDWLVITADLPGLGRGVRGCALAWFLRKYFGWRNVRVCTPAQVRSADALPAVRCLIGLPTTLESSELEQLYTKTGGAQFALFDYRDQHDLGWTEEQVPALQRLTDLYLKPWFEPAWQYDMRMGLLPIRRYGRFTTALGIDRAASKIGLRDQRVYDVGFVGRPNLTRLINDGSVELVEQRAQWIDDLKRKAPELKFWGGLVGVDEAKRRRLANKFEDVDLLLHSDQKVSFPAYYRSLRQCRVLLAPGGNVPWTYRHYECLYCGAVVVSIDYRQRDMLVPLPRESMVHVPDGESVIPYVRQALELFHSRPRLGDVNVAHLERYLRMGAYAKSRRPLVQRFVEQFEPSE